MIEKLEGQIIKAGDFEAEQLSSVEAKLNELIDAVNEQEKRLETNDKAIVDCIKKIDFIMEKGCPNILKQTLKDLYKLNK